MANTTPHSHTPKLRRRLQYIEEGPWIIEYGDTRVRVCGGWRKPTKEDIDKAVRKAVEQHDKGSNRLSEMDSLKVYAAGLVSHSTYPASWGSDQLRSKVESTSE